jgi:hypothetical protein
MTSTSKMRVGQFGRPTLSKDYRTIIVHIPITLRHQSGRKQVVAPAGATPWIPIAASVDSTMVKALVRAYRWRDMLESGKHATVRDLAKAETIDEVYLGRVLRLTLLAPSIVEEVLAGTQPVNLELHDLLKPLPAEWKKQLDTLTVSCPTCRL